MRKRKLILLFLIILFSCDSSEDIITGKVVSVADGDTMTILTVMNERIKIRLEGIDAPERGQDFGSKSREFLNALCYGKPVTVRKKGLDKHGRTLGVVYVGDTNVNEELVRNGLAWYYDYFVQDARLDSLEQLAKKERLNIWSMKNPIPPYEFRKKSKK